MMKHQNAAGQADPAHIQSTGNELEQAIGSQVRRYRKQLGLTVTELAERAELSPGMLSKIENGNISPSLATLRSLSLALNVPVTALFRQFEERGISHFSA
jgi:transcriptional regulator with XRE-family HTH domain